MTFDQGEFDRLVTLMTQHHYVSVDNQMIALMSRANVNHFVHGEPLIVHYLRTCTVPKLNLLTAFAINGCDFNAQSSNDGQTALHVLVGKEMDSKVEPIEMLLSHGADPTVVDNNGFTMSMVALVIVHDPNVMQLLTDPTMIERIVNEDNQLGRDVQTLMASSEFGSNTDLEHLLPLGANVTSVDANGDNCLHHLSRCLTEFTDQLYILKVLLRAGADNSQQNISGLIPLQVALSIEPIMSELILDLEPLVPDENVLKLLVPGPDIETMANEPLNLSVQVWFVARVTRFGFNPPESTLSAVRASKYCSTSLIKHLILTCGVKPTAEDLKIPLLSNRNWDEIKLYTSNMLPKDIGRLNTVIPGIVSQIMKFTDGSLFDKELVIEQLVSNGLVITVPDLEVALIERCRKIVQNAILNMDSSFEDDINREIPDILVQVMRLFFSGSYMVQDLQLVTEHIVNKFHVNVNHISIVNDSVIQCLLDMAGEGSHIATLIGLVASREEFDIEQPVEEGCRKWQ